MGKSSASVLAFALSCMLLLGIASAGIRDDLLNRTEGRLCQGMSEQECGEYIGSLNETAHGYVPNANGSIAQAVGGAPQEAAEEAVQQSLENSVANMPLPPGTSIKINDVSVTPTSIGAETVIVYHGKYGATATVPVTITETTSGTMTATASAPAIALPPGVPLTVSPNENIKAATATLVVQTGPTEAQPVTSVSVSVQSPAKGTKGVTLSKVENGVTIESENITAFTTATIKVEDEMLYVDTPENSYSIILPSDVPALEGQNVSSAVLSMEGGTPVYNVNSTAAGNLFWLFPMAYPVESAIYAENGSVQGKSVPWWAQLFLGA